jgi:hypothetical protein
MTMIHDMQLVIAGIDHIHDPANDLPDPAVDAAIATLVRQCFDNGSPPCW